MSILLVGLCVFENLLIVAASNVHLCENHSFFKASKLQMPLRILITIQWVTLYFVRHMDILVATSCYSGGTWLWSYLLFHVY